MKGIGGIWQNKGGVNKFSACKLCAEIRDTILQPAKFTENFEVLTLCASFLSFFV